MLIKLRIWVMRTFFPEYRKMSELIVVRSNEIYSLQNLQGEHVMLIETQTAAIKVYKQELEAKDTQIVNLTKSLERAGKRRK